MNHGTIGYSYELYIAASPEKVWNGLIDAETTKEYVYGTRLQSTLKPGAAQRDHDQAQPRARRLRRRDRHRYRVGRQLAALAVVAQVGPGDREADRGGQFMSTHRPS